MFSLHLSCFLCLCLASDDSLCIYFMHLMPPTRQIRYCNSNIIVHLSLRPVEDNESTVGQQWFCWGAFGWLQQLPQGLFVYFVQCFGFFFKSLLGWPLLMFKIFLKWLTCFYSWPHFQERKIALQINHMSSLWVSLNLVVIECLSALRNVR